MHNLIAVSEEIMQQEDEDEQFSSDEALMGSYVAAYFNMAVAFEYLN